MSTTPFQLCLPRCTGCGHVSRQDTSRAAGPRAKLSRRALRWALEGIVCQHLTVARVGASSPSPAKSRSLTQVEPGCLHAPRRVSRCDTLWYGDEVADHYTLRLAPGLRQRLSEWARRAGLPERTLAQRYVEEGLRHDAHPLIQFLDGPSGRRASLLGRGLDVWEIIATVRDNNGSVTEAADYLEIPAGLAEAAVNYYGEYREEIDSEIALNEAEYERGRAAAAAGEQALRS
jgi:hypothetical protein